MALNHTNKSIEDIFVGVLSWLKLLSFSFKLPLYIILEEAAISKDFVHLFSKAAQFTICNCCKVLNDLFDHKLVRLVILVLTELFAHQTQALEQESPNFGHATCKPLTNKVTQVVNSRLRLNIGRLALPSEWLIQLNHTGAPHVQGLSD